MADAQTALPPDDPARQLTVARPDIDATLKHYSVVGDTYTILVSGHDSGNRYALIDMHVPPGGGPPPHRHECEEMFHVLAGEVEVMFRGVKTVARTGDTVNIPSLAPHAFKNLSSQPARLLCTVAPAGMDEFFTLIGDPVPTRTSPPPKLNEAEQALRLKKTAELSPKYKNEPA